jgi:hypothetical protein
VVEQVGVDAGVEVDVERLTVFNDGLQGAQPANNSVQQL